MGNERAEVLLAKILTAAAWADGRIDPDEREAVLNCVRHLNLTDGEARSVSILLDAPVPRSDVEALTQSFLQVTESNDAIRRQLLDRVRHVLGDRGSISEAEHEFLGYVAEAIERDRESESFLGRIKSLFTWGALRPQDARRSDVAERLRARIHQPRGEGKLTDPTRQDMATLYGALLHTVALADGVVTDDEVLHISEFLRQTLAYDDHEVDLIVGAIHAELDADVELFRLTSEFNRVTDQAARVELVEAMFSLAAVDGTITDEETDAIRRAADHLWVARRDFNDLRLKYARS